MDSLLRSDAAIGQSVSQTIDDDDTESFFVVQRWDSDSKDKEVTPNSVAAAAETETTRKDSEETLTASSERECLENNDMMKSALSSMDETEAENQSQSQSVVTPVPVAPSVPMSVSQTSGMLVEDAFSMTNYSTASSSSDTQLEELQTTLSGVIDEHKKLKEVLEKQNLELELRQSTIEELKSLSNETIHREKAKSEEFRQLVEKVQKERDAAVAKLHMSNSAIAGSRSASEFEVIETLENQLKQRDDVIQQNGEQVKELSSRLGQAIVRNDELTAVLRSLEKESKNQCDSLTSSDAALAQCFAQKEKVQGDLQEIQHAKQQLQQDLAHLRDQFAAVNTERERLQALAEQMQAKCLGLEGHCSQLDAEKQQLNIQLAALSAETEQQAKVLSEAMEQNQSLQEEKIKLQRDVTLVTEMLETRTKELQITAGASASASSSPATSAGMNASSIGSSIASFPGQMIGLMKRGVTNSYGIRDENDDPNESFGAASFEHVVTPTAPVSAPNVQQEEENPKKCPICLKRFDTVRKLEYHASNCGMGDPFVFP